MFCDRQIHLGLLFRLYMAKLNVDAEFCQVGEPDGLCWRKMVSVAFHLNQFDLLLFSVPDNQIRKTLVKALVVVQ